LNPLIKSPEEGAITSDILKASDESQPPVSISVSNSPGVPDAAHDLQELAAAWPKLSASIRNAITELARAAVKENNA
jgi:hypothetical protein